VSSISYKNQARACHLVSTMMYTTTD